MSDEVKQTRGYPSEEFPVLHTMDGRRIVGPRATWADVAAALTTALGRKQQ